MSILSKLNPFGPRVYHDFGSCGAMPNMLFSRNSSADSGLIQHAANTPRLSNFRYSQNNRGLLRENASTNMLVNSSTTSVGVGWGKQGNGYSSTVLDRIGPVNSDVVRISVTSINTDAQTPGLFNSQVPSLIGQRHYLGSAYVKNNGGSGRKLLICLDDWSGTGRGIVVFELGKYAVTNNFRCYPVGNDWWRVEILYSPTVTSGIGKSYFGLYPVGDAGGGTNPPIGYQIDVCGFQVEDVTGHGYSSSYIPTQGAQVTRAVENFVFNTGGVVPDEFTLVAKLGQETFIDGRILQLSNGTTSTNGTAVLSLEVSNYSQMSLRHNVSGIFATGVTNNTDTGIHVLGFSFSRHTGKINILGNNQVTESTFSPNSIPSTAMNNLFIGLNHDPATSLTSTIVEKLILWPRALSAVELETVHKLIKH